MISSIQFQMTPQQSKVLYKCHIPCTMGSGFQETEIEVMMEQLNQQMLSPRQSHLLP